MDARRVDALLAEHLFGWVRKHSQWGGVLVDRSGNVMARWDEWYPSSTWEGMGRVVEAMAKRKRTLSLLIYDGLSASADFASPGCDRFSASGEADTAPMAVALAALSDLGVEV